MSNKVRRFRDSTKVGEDHNGVASSDRSPDFPNTTVCLRLSEFSKQQFRFWPLFLPHQIHCLRKTLFPLDVLLEGGARSVCLHGLLKFLTTLLQLRSKLASYFARIVFCEFNRTLKILQGFCRT